MYCEERSEVRGVLERVDETVNSSSTIKLYTWEYIHVHVAHITHVHTILVRKTTEYERLKNLLHHFFPQKLRNLIHVCTCMCNKVTVLCPDWGQDCGIGHQDSQTLVFLQRSLDNTLKRKTIHNTTTLKLQ